MRRDLINSQGSDEGGYAVLSHKFVVHIDG
jgi:hypothetical protein